MYDVIDYIRHRQSLEWRDLGRSIRQMTVLAFANNLAVGIAGSRALEIQKLKAILQKKLPAGSCTVFSSTRFFLPKKEAALVNSVAMCTLELDEGYRNAVCHAGLYILPALLAEAEENNHSVEEVLRAFALAYDTVARVALAWKFPRLAIHPHGLLAPIGAAAGVSFLRRFTVDKTVDFLTAASTIGSASPFVTATDGMLVRNSWAALGTASIFKLIYCVESGLVTNVNSLKDTCEALGGVFDVSYFNLNRYPKNAILDGYHKIFACCQYAHSSIEACLQLLEKNPTLKDIKQIKSIKVEIHPKGLLLDDTNPHTTLGAKFSIPHSVAASLVLGHAGIESFDEASLGNEQISFLRKRTTLSPFEGVKAAPFDRPARVSIQLLDGRVFSETCWSAQGGPDRPLTLEQIWSKIASITNADVKNFYHIMFALNKQSCTAPESQHHVSTANYKKTQRAIKEEQNTSFDDLLGLSLKQFIDQIYS